MSCPNMLGTRKRFGTDSTANLAVVRTGGSVAPFLRAVRARRTLPRYAVKQQ